MKMMIIGKIRTSAGSSLVCAAWLLLAGSVVTASSPAKPSWNVELTLEVNGRYRIEDKDGPKIGHYAFTVQWKGTIERDDDDYLLLHNEAALEDWKAAESPAPSTAGRFLDSQDFTDRPAFRFNYILRENEEVQVDFAMDGFPIPVNPSNYKFPLALPASVSNTQAGSEPGYDRCITQGSNRVSLPRAAVESGPVEKTFAWRWKRNNWGLEQDTTVYCLQSHEARLTVSFTPVPAR